MKRLGHLLPEIAELENLRLAFWKAARGKSASADVVAYRARLEENLAALRAALLDGTVRVGGYHFFKIYDPKERQICAADFGERVLHHALVNVCEPVFERRLIHDTYACRAGKGRLKALERAQHFDFGAAAMDEPPGSNRVIRGGSWNNNAIHCRVANHNNNSPGNTNNNVGFRTVRSSENSQEWEEDSDPAAVPTATGVNPAVAKREASSGVSSASRSRVESSGRAARGRAASPSVPNGRAASPKVPTSGVGRGGGGEESGLGGGREGGGAVEFLREQRRTAIAVAENHRPTTFAHARSGNLRRSFPTTGNAPGGSAGGLP